MVIAAPRDGTPSDLSPRIRASRITNVITAARNTEGVGLTKKINKNRMIKTSIILFLNLLTKNCKNQSKKLATKTKLAPLTAVKCESPTFRICS